MSSSLAAFRQASRVVRVPATGRSTAPVLSTGHSTARSLSTTSKLFTKEDQKDMDRNTLKPERTEYSKSGTDNEVASHPSAYDPSKTSPESEVEASGQESAQEGKTSNPLDVSPGNKDVSKAREATEGGPDHNLQKPGPSARGWTRKNKEVNTRH